MPKKAPFFLRRAEFFSDSEIFAAIVMPMQNF